MAAGALLWLGLLLPTYWWVADGGLRTGFAGGAAVLAIGQLTGLVASVLLLAQVVLMARIPVLERAFGQDDLARKHRIVGFTSFNLMLAHILTVTVGYAAGDLLASPGTFWNLTVDYPGMLLALAGTLCLVMVVVTSIRLARRRLRYESWHLLHLYAYLGVGLALPHQLWTGQQFLGSPGRTVFWWTAWARRRRRDRWSGGSPCRRTAPSATTCASPRWCARPTGWCRSTSPDATWTRSGSRPDSSSPGASWPGRGWSRAHPYSLSAAPDGRSLRITVKDLGDGSRDVARLRPGTRVLVEGPYGRLSARARTRRHVALIGAGVGITPLRSLAEGLAYAPGEAVLVHRYGRPAAVRAASSPSWPPSVGSGWSTCPDTGRTRPTTPAPCCTTSPTSPTATSTSAAPSSGPTRSAGRPSPPASRPSTSTSRPSRGDPR